MYTGINGSPINPGNARPFSCRMSFAIVSDKYAVSSVRCLFNSRGPSAILRAIVPIDIDAVDSEIIGISMSKRPVTKSCKVMTPLVTYRNSAGTIVSILSSAFVIAPVFHSNPYAIESPRFASMLIENLGCLFLVHTATRSGVSFL